jgi:uncharacterized protein YdaL
MKRSFGFLLSFGLSVSLASCQTTDLPIGPQASSPVTALPAIGDGAPADQPIDVRFVGNHDQVSMNHFPADFGARQVVPGELVPVPQARGQDTRPRATALLTEFATVPNGALILYDSSGPWGWLGELYGIGASALAGHFGATTTKPVSKYVAGDIAKYLAVIYIGSTYDEPLPVAFLDDVLNSTVPVVWCYDNIWQLANRSSTFVTKYGYNPWAFDTTAIAKVTYKGRTLTRDSTNASGIMQFSPFNTAKVTTLASAVRSNGTTLPWAVRSANLTYVGEVPFAYIASDDRYLIFCDLLFDALAPTTATRHRALARLEDVSPADDPTSFRAAVDYLASQSVPFSIALIPLYKDPLGAYNDGKTLKWSDRPNMLSAVKYATTKGGTVIMHGYTHQFGSQKNPYTGTTADDFEFFLSHIDSSNNVIYDGAVPGDSASWAAGRITSGLAAINAAGLIAPTIFEYPHYAGTPTDSKAIKASFSTVYHRGLYFGGDLGLTSSNLAHMIGMFYPYTVTDVYGWKVLPENLGSYEPQAQNNHPARLASDIVLTAQNNLVIRDSVASFYFHTYNPLSALKSIVSGIKSAGYTFVAASAL